MDKKEVVTKYNFLRETCLKNAEDLLKASKTSLDHGIDHAAFHLALLALEEIGKVELEIIRAMSLLHGSSEPAHFNLDTDDHEKKIFWAFWGSSFGRKKQTKELIDTDKEIAKNLHSRRLEYIYIDPANPKYWKDIMGDGEAKLLYGFVETRLNLELAKSGLVEDAAEEPDEDLDWFLKANQDEQKRTNIWGHKSQDKLLELGDVKAWIKWLKEIYSTEEKELQEMVQKEMQRQQPPKEQRLDPKWRITFEIVTPSHSIRDKNLVAFNDAVSWIKLSRKDAHTLKAEMTHSKNIPIQGLWDYGWGTARSFIAALNISSFGFFWWNIKTDPARYYEKIFDIENNIEVGLEMNPRLEMNWREHRSVLSHADLTFASLVFFYLTHCHLSKKENHIGHYISGLNLLAKNDVHLRVELNAFDEFFKSLKIGMIENGDWDQKEPFENAFQRVVSERFPEVTDGMRQAFSLGFTVEKDHVGPVDLSSVYAMKHYTESYLQMLTLRYFKEVKGQDIHLVLGPRDEANDKAYD